jgi:hypothetical protein
VDIWVNTRLLPSTHQHSPNNTATELEVLAVLFEVLVVVAVVVVVVNYFQKKKPFLYITTIKVKNF